MTTLTKYKKQFRRRNECLNEKAVCPIRAGRRCVRDRAHFAPEKRRTEKTHKVKTVKSELGDLRVVFNNAVGGF